MTKKEHKLRSDLLNARIFIERYRRIFAEGYDPCPESYSLFPKLTTEDIDDEERILRIDKKRS